MSSTVSIIISSYNSSHFIVETLESVLQQTWKPIELIITDDCSKDNTVEISRNWMEKNKNRFVNTQFLISEVNTGVSANANRGLFASNGDWIKFLAADDTLKPNCIEENMNWVNTNSEVKALFSSIEIYDGTFEPNKLIETIPGVPNDINSLFAADRTAESQYNMLLISDRIHFTPSIFLNRETLLSVGGFDENFKLLEDYPLWLKLTKNGHKLFYMNKVTVNYRRHPKAINNTGRPFLINPNYFKLEEFRKVYTYPYLPLDIKLNSRFYWHITKLFRFDWLNVNKAPNRFLHSLLTVYLNPFKYYIWLKKQIRKDLKNNEFYK